MPGLYSDDTKRRVRDANNLVDVVQASVGKLVRAGRNLKACCPFHKEKTPSFNVNAEGQYFKCFGCGKSGDVFTFVMLSERVEFPEALQILADRAGIRLEVDPRAVAQYKKETDFKGYLYRLNDAAARFFREQLFSDAGKTAREYLKKRNLSDAICERFKLGYAPAGGSPLLGRLQGVHHAPLKAIERAGLISIRDDGSQSARDFFYDRLMFPITDIQGRVIAFGGRILGDGEPKYLNTRETPLFSKTKTVYGIDLAREEIVNTNTAILVEGYTDVMMCHQFGVTNVVACLGTAITADHVRQLRRVAENLVLLTDSDAAGAKASERSLAVLFQEKMMKASVARLPGADKDPCDFLLAKGKEPFVAALKQTVDLFDYKFEMVCKRHDLLTALGQRNAVDELMELISGIPDTLLKNQYRYQILKRLNIDERELRYQVPAAAAAAAAAEGAPAKNPAGENGEIGDVPPAAGELASAERELLRFLFHEPAWLAEAMSQIDLAAFSGAPERLIGQALLEAVGDGKLPPEASALADAGCGSLVAREILQRLPDSSEDGIMILDGARALCIALAETPFVGEKLETRRQWSITLGKVREGKLSQQHEVAARRLTNAKLAGNKVEEKEAYDLTVRLRSEIAKLKPKARPRRS